MAAPVLTDFWRDWLSIISIAISVVGFVLTVVSLLYAIGQIRMTKTAAVAAEEAAKKTLLESEFLFTRFAVANALRFLAEVRIHLDSKSWELAALRLGDLGDQVVQLAKLDSECENLVFGLRKWEAVARKLSRVEGKFAETKWQTFCVQLQQKMDQLHTPFQRDARSELS